MKIFISADIEGIASTTSWEDTRPAEKAYPFHAKQMTNEVLAAIEGATAAGATEIVVRDAHGPANNIDISVLPEHVSIIRGWSGHPYSMVDGIDSSFDAAMFIGYHSAAGVLGNPMCHTMTTRTQKAMINGQPLSEFLLYSWCAANEGVPTLFLSGDKDLCQQGVNLYPWLKTAPVKEGFGYETRAVSPAKAVSMIRENAYEAVKNADLSKCKFQLPEHFSVQLTYKEHCFAHKMSFFPGVMRLDSHTVGFEENDFFETVRKLYFIL